MSDDVNEENARNVPLDLLRAELKSAMAEQMVVLIDRFTGKHDFEELKRTVAVNKEATDSRFGQVAELLQQTAVTEERVRQIADEAIDSRESRSWSLRSGKAAMGMFMTGMIALLSSPFFAYLIQRHFHS